MVSYDVWLPRFVASLAWRVLGRVMDGGTNILPEVRHEVREAREVWRRFAAGDAASPGRFALHMLPIVSLADNWRQDAYAHRAGQMQALSSRSGDAFVWMKLPGVLCLGTLAGTMPLDNPLRGRPAVWHAAAHHVPGLIRFVMFEELQRSLQPCHEPSAAIAGCEVRSQRAGGA